MATENHPDSPTTEIANATPAGAPSPTARRPGSAWVTPVLVLAAVGLLMLVWQVAAPKRRFNEDEFFTQMRSGHYDAAERLLREHLSAHPDDARVRFLIAEFLLERPTQNEAGARSDDATEALEHLEKLPKTGEFKRPDSPATRALYRGKAARILKRWDTAEREWLEAMRLNPQVPEAGLGLLDLYYVEMRRREARELALRLFEVEPDPHDRALIMTSLLFQDAVKPDAKSLVPILQSVTEAEPEGLHSQIAYGLALIRDNEVDRGLAVLEKVLKAAKDSAETDDAPQLVALEGFLTGLDLANRHDALAELLAQQPAERLRSPRLARFVGLAAQSRQDWPAAIDSYKAALDFDPGDSETRARLGQVLRIAERTDEADTFEAAALAARQASTSLLALHDQASTLPGLGVTPQTELCEGLARAYEAMGRAPEAAAWRKIGEGQAEPN